MNRARKVSGDDQRVRIYKYHSPVFMAAIAGMLSLLTACGGGVKEKTLRYEPGYGWTGSRSRQDTVSYQIQQQTPEQITTRPADTSIQEDPQVYIPSKPDEVSESELIEQTHYTIQLSVWRTERIAREQADIYRELGLDTYIQRVVLPETGIWYRIRFGEYFNLAEARRRAQAISDSLHIQAWVDYYRTEAIPPD